MSLLNPERSGLLAKVGSPDPSIEIEKRLKAFKKTKDAKALADWVREQHTKAKNARSKDVQQWNMNLAMYFGNQNVLVYGGGSQYAGKFFTPPARKAGGDRLVINRIKPLIRTELARVLSQKPTASVVPATSEDEDMMAAQSGEQVWESLYNRRKFHTHFSRAAFWQVITGTGFLKTYWDDNAIDRDSVNRPGVPTPQGDVVFESIQPYNLFVPDLLQQDIEDQPYVLEVKVKPVEWVNYIFKNVLDKPARAVARAATSILEDAYAQQITDNNAAPDSCLIYEMWLKPGACRLVPDGGYIMLVNDEIVCYYPDGIPYEHQEFPYTKFEHVPTSKFYADSVIVDIIALQKEYNKIRTQIAENRRKMGNIQAAAHKGSILPEKITNEVGQFLMVRPGMQFPQALQPAQLPSYISENMDRVLSDIEDISGQHQVSKGNVPSGITAATAISYLQERDDSLLTHTYQSIESGVERAARQALMLAVQYWDTPRLIRTVGADGAFDTQLLSGADLVTATDIRIEAGSALPQSKAAKQALIMDLMKFGWVKPEDGLKMMEIGGAQKIFEQIRQDERQAQRENVRLKNIGEDEIEMHEMAWNQAVSEGDPATISTETNQSLDVPPVIPVNSYDNHQVHIDVHNRYRRGQAFELLPDAVKAQFEAHVNMHKSMLMQQQAEQFMSMIPGDGTESSPVGPGGGSVPPSEDVMGAMNAEGSSPGMTDGMGELGG